jgi:ketosteroid isomerase-like protein
VKQKPSQRQAADATAIRQLIDDWARAVRERDLEGVLAHHADGIRLFDVPPPLESRGINAYRKSWQDEFFPWLGEAGIFEVDQLEIAAGDDVAFCHGLIRCGGTEPNGHPSQELNVRLTVGLVKVEGSWTVVHEHPSEPSA